jgi:hypothetical protein
MRTAEQTMLSPFNMFTEITGWVNLTPLGSSDLYPSGALTCIHLELSGISQKMLLEQGELW